MKDKAFQSAIDIVRTGDTITMSDLIKQGYSCTQSLKAMTTLLEKGIIKDAGEGVFAVVADEIEIDDVAVSGGAIKRKFTSQKMDEIVELLNGKTMDALKRIYHHERTWHVGITPDDEYMFDVYTALEKLGLVAQVDEKYSCTLTAEDYEELCAKFRDYTTRLRVERIKKRREEFERAQKQKERKDVANAETNSSEPVGTSAIRDEDDRKMIEDVLSGVDASETEEMPKSNFDALEEQIKRFREKQKENTDVVFYVQMTNGTDSAYIGVEKDDKLIDLIKKTARVAGNSTLLKIVGGGSNLVKILSSENVEKNKAGAFFLETQDFKIALNWEKSVFEQCKTELGELLSKKEDATIKIVFYKV
jgi:hypothetical protein